MRSSQGCSTLCLPFPLRHVRAVWPFGWLEIDISVSVTGSTVFRIWGKPKFSSLWDKCPGVHGGLYDTCTFHFYKTETCFQEWLCLFTFLTAMWRHPVSLHPLPRLELSLSLFNCENNASHEIHHLKCKSIVQWGFQHSPCCASSFENFSSCKSKTLHPLNENPVPCLLYTSDAADDNRLV